MQIVKQVLLYQFVLLLVWMLNRGLKYSSFQFVSLNESDLLIAYNELNTNLKFHSFDVSERNIGTSIYAVVV